MAEVEKHEFKAEIKQLLSLLSESLYVNKDVFLRELISNASDASNKIRFHMLTDKNVNNPDLPLEIEIEIKTDEDQLIVKDNGIGLTHDEIIQEIGVIASSGTKKFLDKLKEGEEGADMIGQFGVGFYSVFMVAEEVTVESLSYDKSAEPVTWKSSGVGTFTVSKGTKETRGTSIIIDLKDNAKEYLSADQLRTIIKKYSNYINFPIYLNIDGEREEEPVNKQKPIWRRRKSDIEEEEYKEFFQYIAPASLGSYITKEHFSTELPFRFYALIYLPEKMNENMLQLEEDWGLKLYSKQVLIQNHNKKLLPEWLKFVKGVVDADDLPLNVSREVVQVDRKLLRIKKAITGKILKELERMAEEEEETYIQFWEEFSLFLKHGAISDHSRRESLLDLLRFKSVSNPETMISLKDYVDHMSDEQEGIYYLLGEDLETMKRSPHLEYYKKHEIDVLLMDEPSDAFLLTNIFQYDDKKFINVDQAKKDVQEEKDKEEETEEEEADQEPQDPLLKHVKEVLGEKVTEVVFTDSLTDSPCRVLNPSTAIPTNMQRVFQYMNTAKNQAPFTGGPKRFELNPEHPIIGNLQRLLSENSSEKLVDLAIYQLFASALMLEGIAPKPAEFVPKMYQFTEEALKQEKN